MLPRSGLKSNYDGGHFWGGAYSLLDFGKPGVGRGLSLSVQRSGALLLDAQVAPGDRITPDRVKAYVGHLEAENASGTVIARIIELKVTAAIMDAERDWSWIYRFASSMRARHKPADQSGIVWSISGGC